MRGRSVFLFGVLGGLLVLSCGACKRSQPVHNLQVDTICIECNKPATVPVAKPVHQETWPRECGACRKAAVYAVGGSCINCSKLVPLKATDGNMFGYPKRCPACGKVWEN